MKPALQLRHSQQLTLTPQLQQSIRLLQLSTLEVNQEIVRLLDENPLLEREDGVLSSFEGSGGSIEKNHSSSDEPYSAEDDWSQPEWNDAPYSSSSQDDEVHPQSEAAAGSSSLREHLLRQTNISQHELRDQKIIGLLIDALDENGYLAQPLEEIAELLPPELDITLDDLETALTQLQNLGEPGIGARTLGECLTLQLKALPRDTPERDLALRITAHHLDLLAARDFTKLKRLLRCDDDALRAAQALIVRLNPKPGAEFEDSTADYVVPDVIVERHRGVWRARLNAETMPRLRVNQMYANILQQRDDKNAQQLAGQLQEARWLIKNLQQRCDTILRVSQAIVERQRNFFEHGEIAMRPLVLREIAEQLEMHESTISRITTQKYMLTPRGIYELKYFFGSGLATEEGGTLSSTAIRALIQQMVSEENAQRPLSDSRMAEILEQQGILVARRTVAKYRELMHIPPVHLRKTL
ncbi:MAG: RNA polymerase factor sigma-54 [Gallionellaceae bacterium]|jgi:RNA polymerase sigma-54 factor|nr:RNA polymerase factor sigma-54 [Gallionellaceae bacterium]